MTILKGINPEYPSYLMAAWGLKLILDEDHEDHIWFERFGPYKYEVLFSDLPKNEIILKVAKYFKDNKPSSIDDITIREYVKNKKNLYLPRIIAKIDPRKRVYDILVEEPLLEYIYDTLFIHPYIQGKNITPIQFAKESQRDSAKIGYDSGDAKNIPLTCNVIIHNLMWIAINKYIGTKEIDSLKDIKDIYNSNIGFYFINDLYKKTKSLRGSTRLLIPIFGKNGCYLTSILYKQESLDGGASAYAYWEFERYV